MMRARQRGPLDEKVIDKELPAHVNRNYALRRRQIRGRDRIAPHILDARRKRRRQADAVVEQLALRRWLGGAKRAEAGGAEYAELEEAPAILVWFHASPLCSNLIVEDGDHGNASDWGVWLEPTLFRYDNPGIGLTSPRRAMAASAGCSRSWPTSKQVCKMVEIRLRFVWASTAGSPPSRVDWPMTRPPGVPPP